MQTRAKRRRIHEARAARSQTLLAALPGSAERNAVRLGGGVGGGEGTLARLPRELVCAIAQFLTLHEHARLNVVSGAFGALLQRPESLCPHVRVRGGNKQLQWLYVSRHLSPATRALYLAPCHSVHAEMSSAASCRALVQDVCGRATQLRKLDVTVQGEANLRQLRDALPRLRTLHLRYGGPPGASGKLRLLRVMTEQGKGFGALKSLSLSWWGDDARSKVGAGLHASLRAMPRLTSLSVSCWHEVNDALARTLADHLPRLRRLDLSSFPTAFSGLSNAGLRDLARLSRLHMLRLATSHHGHAHKRCKARFDDTGIGELQRLTHLRILDMPAGRRVTGACLAQLATLPLLTQLRVSGYDRFDLSQLSHLRHAPLQQLSLDIDLHARVLAHLSMLHQGEIERSFTFVRALLEVRATTRHPPEPAAMRAGTSAISDDAAVQVAAVDAAAIQTRTGADAGAGATATTATDINTDTAATNAVTQASAEASAAANAPADNDDDNEDDGDKGAPDVKIALGRLIFCRNDSAYAFKLLKALLHRVQVRRRVQVQFLATGTVFALEPLLCGAC